MKIKLLAILFGAELLTLSILGELGIIYNSMNPILYRTGNCSGIFKINNEVNYFMKMQ